ncbi:hypothetical protein BOO69_07325 [Sulfitobacter alexandrii]|uniref:Uncharacterized protein n=1 Tax=Sulfitobacter alexandrii TaxID=1917485 RepID=A0A1J0WGD7_9RHOB|nr:hypothetical protein BOO69_07325 [Sulfitobacter alexandrii]
MAGVEDLEVALRVPLMSFARMSEALGRRSDTLSKALREGRETLPFPLITLGPRTRVFRKLEVRLWAEEEIRLDLPKALGWTTPAPEQVEGGVEETEGSSFLDEDPLSADPAKKAIFGQFAGPKQKPAT